MTQHDDNPAAKLREGAEPVAWTQPGALLAVQDGVIGQMWAKRDEDEVRRLLDIAMPDDVPLYLHPTTEQTDARSGVRVALEKLERYVALYCFDVWSPEDHEKSPVLNALLDQTRRILSALSPAAPEPQTRTVMTEFGPVHVTGAEDDVAEQIASMSPDPTPVDDDISRVYEDHEPAAPEGQQEDMRAICEALGFDPTNHHNAARCPYCNPLALESQETVADATRAFMSLFVRDGMDPPVLSVEDIDANELANRYEALSCALSRPEADQFDRADWYWRTLDPDDSADNPSEAIHCGMVGNFVVCEIACSYSGPTRYGFNAPVLDPESDDEEFLHFATQEKALAAAKARIAALEGK